jgi:oligopeptide/dipeptide ABC transporter ATP-binding protein
MRAMRSKLQIVFQNPYSSLNPNMTIQEHVEAPLKSFKRGTKKERGAAVAAILDRVGILAQDAAKYPHEFSGGQRQRIGIACALVLNPEFVVFDEPVSALDVSVQAQILNLIKSIKDESRLTSLFISHDLGVVKHVCNRIAVMYMGKIVELASKKSLFDAPMHPYTKGLIEAIPIPDLSVRKSAPLKLRGDIADAYENAGGGCRFYPRCALAGEICRRPENLELREVENGHFVACANLSK